ncbi:MAG TPA: BON domain-containing protein [Opitutaceae bacterium]|nr:BON domain-containing protein [Opitutaceae bacterium]
MKNAIIFLLIGGVLGAFCLHVYQQHEAEQRVAAAPAPVSSSPPSAPQDGHPPGGETDDEISQKLAEWHLTPDDIKNDLARTGAVVRTRAKAVGEKIDDARIVAVIKAKFVLDRDLSARDIRVEAHQGAVTLNGTVATPALVGKAVVLALDTEGVQTVAAQLQPANP